MKSGNISNGASTGLRPSYLTIYLGSGSPPPFGSVRFGSESVSRWAPLPHLLLSTPTILSLVWPA